MALVAPAGPLPPGAQERAAERVRELGWEPVLGAHVRARTGYLAGSDDARLSDLQAALDAGANDAIWCLRGGYGTMRIVSRIDFSGLRSDPRPLIGFSDNTVLHLAAGRVGIVTFHGPHAGVSDFPDATRDVFLRVLEDPSGGFELPVRTAAAPGIETAVPGVAEGALMGGNLSLLAATVGTPFQMSARDRILFIEEVGESAYRIDRLLTQLLLSGALEGVRGVAVGAFSECPDEGSGMPSPYDVVRERLGGLGVPLVCGFPFGHIPENWTLPIGPVVRLDATRGRLTLLEGSVE